MIKNSYLNLPIKPVWKKFLNITIKNIDMVERDILICRGRGEMMDIFCG